MDSEEPPEGTLRRTALLPLRLHGNARRRFHSAVLVAGILLCGVGLLSYGLVAPEIPFAEAPVTYAGELHAGDIAKVFGRISCQCNKAIDREEVRVGTNGRNWNATYADFSVSDPSGSIHIDTDSITRLPPGPNGGDWLNTDYAAVYGAVYDQGTGVLTLRAYMIAKAPDDTLAKYAFWTLVTAALGGLAIAYLVTDRLVFGGP